MRVKLFTLSSVTVLLACVLTAAGTDLRLVDATRSGDVKAVRAALQQGVPVTAAEPDGSTALHEAVRRDNLEIANLLIAAGADVKVANRYNITPLSIACANGSNSSGGTKASNNFA